MRPFTHGFVGRTATAVDGDVVWASATYDGASADTKTALERTSLEVIAKHSADHAGLYETTRHRCSVRKHNSNT